MAKPSRMGSDSATTRAFVNAYVQPRYLTPAGTSPTELSRLEGQLATLTRPTEILLVELLLPDGTVVAASQPGLHGTRPDADGDFALAAGGTARAAIAPPDSGTALNTIPPDRASPTTLRVVSVLALEIRMLWSIT